MFDVCRYATEDMARTTRTGRLGDVPVPLIAVGLAREEAVGPRGERPAMAAYGERQEMERVSEEKRGRRVVLEIKCSVFPLSFFRYFGDYSPDFQKLSFCFPD